MALPFITQGFRMARHFSVVLRSVLALALAAVAVPLVNLAGGELAGLLRLPRGGDSPPLRGRNRTILGPR